MAYNRAATTRFVLGCILMVGGTAIVLSAIWVGSSSIDSVAYISPVTPPKEPSVDYHFAYLKFAAHAVVTVTAVLFGYSMIRASERMFIPRWLLREGEVEVIRALLGFESPITTALKITKEVGAALADVAQPITKIIERK